MLLLTTPRSLGGFETDPVTRALVAEEIGRHDSAAAWTLENPLDWAFFCCRLPDEGAEEIYSGGADILIDAQFGRPLKATSANGGYRIEQKADLLLAMAHAMSSAVQAVELACSIAGTTAFRASSPLERCFRDVQTM
jgi:alkylation response protein AidB-like acyl-CoA dehydrogenase